MRFAIEIARFKEWALQCEGTFGEWECDYEHWHSLYAVTQKLMSRYADELPDSETCLDLLYVIARDNESGILRDDLERYPELLRHLARLAVDSAESDARYQIVEAVAAAKLSDAADLIRPYLSDSDEYVGQAYWR